MLGLDNPLHIAFLLVLLLLVFGAKRLPELGKSLGSGLRGFKDSLSGEESEHDEISATPVEGTPALNDGARPAVGQEPSAPVATGERIPEIAASGR